MEQRNSRDGERRVLPTQKPLDELLDEEDYEPRPMSAQQEQDEVIIEAMRNIPEEPETLSPNAQDSFAASSKGLLSLKKGLLARGMTDEEAEAYIRMI